VLSPLVSMECEKRAVRDFHSAVNPEANGETFLTLPTERPAPKTEADDGNDSEFIQNRKIQIQEPNREVTRDSTPMKNTPWILPLSKSAVTDECPFSMIPPNIHIREPPSSTALDGSPMS
jgi:hypothetical protein